MSYLIAAALFIAPAAFAYRGGAQPDRIAISVEQISKEAMKNPVGTAYRSTGLAGGASRRGMAQARKHAQRNLATPSLKNLIRAMRDHERSLRRLIRAMEAHERELQRRPP